MEGINKAVKVSNMLSARSGNPVANQFVIESETKRVFQSYDSTIVVIDHSKEQPEDGSLSSPQVYLDEDTWDYSVTTNKYRSQFLGENKDETLAKINSGEYILTNLN